MTWTQVIDTEEDVFKATCSDQFGVVVGHVIRFYDDAPTYAWAHGNRLGAFENDGSAKAAVEAEHTANKG